MPPLDKVLRAGADVLAQTTQNPVGTDLRSLKNNQQQNNLEGFSLPQISLDQNRSSVVRPTASPNAPTVTTPTPSPATSGPVPVGVQSGGSISNPQGGGVQDRADVNRSFDPSGIRGAGRATSGVDNVGRGLVAGGLPGGGLATVAGALQAAGVPSTVGGPVNPSNLNQRNRAAYNKAQAKALEESKAKISKTKTTTTAGKTLNTLGIGNPGKGPGVSEETALSREARERDRNPGGLSDNERSGTRGAGNRGNDTGTRGFF